MPVLRTNRISRTKIALVHEIEQLVVLAKEHRMSLASFSLERLTKLELMILDSAFKKLPLKTTDNTLLILPDDYNILLQNLITFLLEMLQNSTVSYFISD